MSAKTIWSLSSSSAKLLAFMLPLVLVTALFSLARVSSPARVLLSGYSWSRSKIDVRGTAPAQADGGPMQAAFDVKEKMVEDAIAIAAGVRVTLPETRNDSASPPLGMEVAGTQLNSDQTNPATGDRPGSFSLNASDSPPLSQTVVLPEKPMPPPVQPPPRQYTKLDRLEASLNKARSAIKEAKNGDSASDPLYVPVGPMYRNANAFHRSYLEMEKQFKVFVYEEGEPPVFHSGPCKSIYAMEGNFIHMMETVIDYLNVVSTKYPYWNRSLGADHFMLACHDWGPETSRAVPNLYKNSIRVLCNANTSEGFNPAKDASFPEINLQTGGLRGLIGGPSPSHRPILAFFAGGLHGPIRPILLENWEHKNDPDMRIHRYLPRGVSYLDQMRKSKFCICPSGYEVASPRVVEAIYTGCVPVLISDGYVPPFSDVLNWKSFSVEVPVSEIPNLKGILTSISPRQYIRMQRRHFEVNSPPKRYDVFHMILHSVWLRRLNVKIHD